MKFKSELKPKVAGLFLLCALMLTFTYLFVQAGETMIPLLLLFIAVVSALSLIGLVRKK